MRAGLTNAGLIAASLAVGLLLLEGGLRLAGYRYNTLTQAPREDEAVSAAERKGQFTQVFAAWEQFEYDPELFWRPRANVSVFNEFGVRGPVWGPKRAGSPLRVAAVGDSNTLGYLRGHQSHWPGFVQEHFDPRDLQVINAGAHGYSAHQGLVRFRSILPLEPDFVTISFGGNDGHYGGFSDRDYAERIAFLKPFDALRIDDLLLQAYDTAFPLADYETLRQRVPLERYKAHLEAMTAICREQGIQCLLLTRPFNPDDPVAAESLASDPLYFMHVIRDYNAMTERVARETGTALLDVAAIFEGKPWLFTDSSHFTTLGQRMLGDLVAQHVRRTFPRLPQVRRTLYLRLDITAFDGMQRASSLPTWSRGAFRVDLSRLTLRPGDERIILRTRGLRRFETPEEVGLTAALDGAPLAFIEKTPKAIHFALPPDLESARLLSVAIDSFRPSDLDAESDDRRRLGLDILAVQLR